VIHFKCTQTVTRIQSNFYIFSVRFLNIYCQSPDGLPFRGSSPHQWRTDDLVPKNDRAQKLVI